MDKKTDIQQDKPGNSDSLNLSQEEKEKRVIKPKWYCSYPILIISLLFCFPISFVLTLLRLWTIKYQKKGYKIRSILAVLFHVLFILMTVGMVVSETKWEKQFQNYMTAQEYQNALAMLDEHFGESLTKTGLDRYFDVFEASGDYGIADAVVLRYFDSLGDKTSFDRSVFSEIEGMSNKLSEEQQKTMEQIKADVELAIEEKAERESRKAEEESRKAAERES